MQLRRLNKTARSCGARRQHDEIARQCTKNQIKGPVVWGQSRVPQPYRSDVRSRT